VSFVDRRARAIEEIRVALQPWLIQDTYKFQRKRDRSVQRETQRWWKQPLPSKTRRQTPLLLAQHDNGEGDGGAGVESLLRLLRLLLLWSRFIILAFYLHQALKAVVRRRPAGDRTNEWTNHHHVFRNTDLARQLHLPRPIEPTTPVKDEEDVDDAKEATQSKKSKTPMIVLA
jgi:hypothetical protein